MNEKNEAKNMKELNKTQMETVNAGTDDPPARQDPSAVVKEPRCKFCDKDLKNVGGLYYKCFNDNCVNFGVLVYADNT